MYDNTIIIQVTQPVTENSCELSDHISINNAWDKLIYFTFGSIRLDENSALFAQCQTSIKTSSSTFMSHIGAERALSCLDYD